MVTFELFSLFLLNTPLITEVPLPKPDLTAEVLLPKPDLTAEVPLPNPDLTAPAPLPILDLTRSALLPTALPVFVKICFIHPGAVPSRRSRLQRPH